MWTGIELLPAIQEVRLEYPILESLASFMSSWVFYLVIPIMIFAAFYWLVDKRQGEVIGLAFVSSMLFSMLVKFYIAQPRPWVLDPGIQHVEGVHAEDYSCPSGHATASASSYLPAALFVRKRWLSVVLIILMVSVIAGRLILCVHTPLDIIIGVSVGAVAFLFAAMSERWCYGDSFRFHVVNAAYSIAFLPILVVSIVVRGADVLDVITYASFFYGMILGRELDSRYLRYRVPEMDGAKSMVVYVCGMLAVAAILLIPIFLIPGIGKPIGGFAMMLWIYCLFPLIIKKRISG